MVCQSSVLGVKSKVQVSNEEVKLESSTKPEILCSRFGGCGLKIRGDDKGKS